MSTLTSPREPIAPAVCPDLTDLASADPSRYDQALEAVCAEAWRRVTRRDAGPMLELALSVLERDRGGPAARVVTGMALQRHPGLDAELARRLVRPGLPPAASGAVLDALTLCGRIECAEAIALLVSAPQVDVDCRLRALETYAVVADDPGDFLAKLADSPTEPARLRLAAVGVLGMLRSEGTSAELASLVRSARSPGVARAAALALGRSGTAPSIQHLCDLAQHRSPLCRLHALAGLALAPGSRVTRVLEHTVRSGQGLLRRAALLALHRRSQSSCVLRRLEGAEPAVATRALLADLATLRPHS